ncbi:MAG: choice-of-anchor B family protein [Bacteroidota bacterium]
MKNKYILFTLLMLAVTSVGAQVYDFNNITFKSNWFNPNEPVATAYGIKYNGIWGWADASGNEYAIVGAASGTYFIDVTNPAAPVQRDYVQGRRNNCIWREIKTYQHYAYMVSDDSSPNSLQIVDLSYLPDSVHVVYDDNTLFSRSHTIYIEGDKLYGGTVNGGSVGNSSMAVFSLANPELPVLLRSLNSDFSIPGGSVHDMFVKGDTIYASCGYSGLYIFSLGANNHFQYINSLITYIDQGYNHSSALDVSGTKLYFTDEVPDGMDVKVLDVTDLTNLTVVNNFHSNDLATPHNPFVKGNLLYIAYYQDGLQVYDISNPSSPVLAGYFDTYYQNPTGTYPSPAYAGAWGCYPWLPSGNILVSDMQNGLFVLDASAISSIKSTETNTFNIYPNPVHAGNKFRIVTGNEVVNGTVIITDMEGKTIYKNTFNSANTTLETKGYSPGLYMIHLESNGKSTVRKLTVIE